jgi:hypothetical protein
LGCDEIEDRQEDESNHTQAEIIYRSEIDDLGNFNFCGFSVFLDRVASLDLASIRCRDVNEWRMSTEFGRENI